MKPVIIINPFPIEDVANSMLGVIGGTQSRAVTIKDGLKALGYKAEILSLGYGDNGSSSRFGDWRSAEGTSSGYQEMARYISGGPDSQLFLLLNRSANIEQQLSLLDALPGDRFEKTLFTTLSEYPGVLPESITSSLKRQRRIITQQFSTKRWLMQLGVKGERVEVIYNPVDRLRFSPLNTKEKRRSRIRLGIDDSSNVLLYTSRRLKKKGFDTLLALIEKFEDSPLDQKLTFLIAGGNDLNCEGVEMYERLSELATSARSIKVIDIGRLPYQRIESLYKVSDLYLQLSREEGLSNSLLEAIASGLPVIGSDIKENDPAAIDKFNGLRFEVGDVDDLFEKVVKMVSDTALMRKYSRNSRYLSRSFDQKRILKEYLGGFEKRECLGRDTRCYN